VRPGANHSLWRCPSCGRRFRRTLQPHACGLGSRVALLRGKPPTLAKLYQTLERDLSRWGPHETFARGRYALFRTTRGFADLAFMREGLRLALYLGTRIEAPCFFKVVRVSSHRIIHVAMLRGPADWRSVRPFLKEAYLFARQDESPHRKLRKAPRR